MICGIKRPLGLRLQLMAGQCHDQAQAIPLVEGFAFDHLIADRGYAAQDFYDWVKSEEMEPVIPPHPCAKGEKAERPYDKWLYRERHLVECFINKIKHFRRVFPVLTNWLDAILAFCNLSVH